MWRLLRQNFPELRFRRRVPIFDFIADFANHQRRLIIEVDGGQHGDAEHSERTRLIETEGYRRPRFSNNDVCAILKES